MSEGDAPADAAAGREIWIEKYRPEGFDDIHGQEDIVGRLRSYVERDDLPHLLFAGPAGTGKCVTGDTPVLTNRGIERIESIVGDVDGFASPDEGVKVLSLTDANEFEYVEPSHVFGKEASKLRRIETRDGETMEVTPEHKLLVLTEDGLTWTEADDVDDGDRIARPRSVPTPSRSESKATAQAGVELHWLDSVDEDRIRIRLTEQFASELGHPSTTIFPDRLRALDPDTETLEAGVESIQYVNSVGGESRPITPPWRLTPELARFVGLAVAEANIDGGRIKFDNTDDDLCDAFAESARSLFGLDPKRGTQKGVPYVAVRSQTLTHLLRESFDVFRSASGGPGIGSTLVAGDDESRAAFLRAMFDGEAHVSDNGIVELTQKNANHITLLSYLLSTFGIPSRRQTVQKSATNGTGIEREYHVLYVSGARSLRQFADEIGFSIERKQRRLETHTGKRSNPNHDTIPRQRAARQLCTDLNLPTQSPLSDTLDPDNPGREAHESELSDVVAAATDRIEAAQETLARIERLSSELSDATATPAEWLRAREQLEPITVRREISESTGVRNDRLLEYADGRHTPYASRVATLLSELDGEERDTTASDAGQTANIGRLEQELSACVDALGVSYERVAEETNLRGADVNHLLTEEGQELDGLVRFETVADRLRELANEMLSLDVIERLDSISRVADADLYYDEVTSVETVDEPRRVYDLTVPSSRNYVAGTVPTVMHNTTSATAIARAIYGDDWRNNFLELNASDERGIDVVRDRIKNFARSSFGGYDHRVIFLDEADSLCVPPGTEVVTGYPSSPEVKPIEEVAEDGEPIPSVDFETNEIQSDKGTLVDSGTADFFEVELADGRTITASLTHPFFVVGEDGKLVEKELRELAPGDEIADFKDDIGVSQCEVCGDWTAGRFCSLDCKDDGRSRETEFDAAVVSDGGREAVETVAISRIDYSHRGKAYNISMEDTPNFMLANGILTHNTDDAQSALRRTMEQFADNTRFILSCNYSSKIIDPIQSRCAVFRFSPLGDDAIAAQVREIAAAEGIEVTEDGLDALVYAASGDMRRAINALQAAATTGEVVDEEAVFMITSTARPEDIEEMVEAAIDGDFAAARSQLETLLVDTGMAGGDIIDQLHRSAWDFDLDDRTTIRLMERIGEADYRITAGANERVQLEALLASLAAEQ
jgi:DNA polymerase III delta prime subunit